MIGLSTDIELAVQTILDGLELKLEINDIDDDKIRRVMDSKVHSFKNSKELLDKWVNSPNAPSQDKLRKYIERLVIAGDESINTLRQALAKRIDYAELAPERISEAVRAKSTILEYIHGLDSNLMDLRVQIEADKFSLSDREFKLGYPERFARGDFYPIDNYHKQWYNEKKDAVMICPNGTKGDIIELDGLKIQLPQKPNKSEILFSDLPKKDQYWRRHTEPDGLNPDSEDAFSEYIYREYKRRREGIWFMNNGEAVYLTGDAYFALQHCKMRDDGGYMSFRYAQLNMFYFIKACFVDTRCMGQLFVKSRRTGFTYIMLSTMLNHATSTRNVNIGLTSQSDEDAMKAFQKFSYMFRNLPFYFRPVVRGAADSSKNIEFALPPDKSKASKLARRNKGEDYLNTLVDYQPTKDGSYDGQKMYIYLGDECYSPETEILMSDMTFKRIDQIVVGDLVMNGQGRICKVKRTTSGESEMYRVEQPYGRDYVVSKNHNLLFEYGNSRARTKDLIIKPDEYIAMSDYKKSITRRKVFGGVELEEANLPIDPYVLGVWLGDGYSKATQFIFNHKKDQNILNYLIDYFNQDSDYTFNMIEESENWQKWYLKCKGSGNKFKDILSELGVFGDKRIPRSYLQSSRDQRLQLLAGIIDTDGYRAKGNSLVVVMSRKDLVDDIYHLSKSLGLDTSEVLEYVSNYDTPCYRISITDYNAVIPCKLSRKKVSASPTRNRRSRIKDVVPIGIGEFVGIELDVDNDLDRQLVLSDYTLSMNSSKWKKPANYENHWGRISPTFDEGGVIVGKAFIGSTVNPMRQGGEEFKKLYHQSIISKRDDITQRTPSGLYSYFLPAHKNMTKFTDIYGRCWEEKPDVDITNVHGDPIRIGSIAFLESRRKAKKKESDIAYNEELRAFPMTVLEALRDEAKSNIFSIEKINEQIQYNETQIILDRYVTRGNFMWKDGVKDTEVVWYPDSNGRFLVTWLPDESLRNKKTKKNGVWHPVNSHIGCFGADTYDISGTVSGKGSKGSVHGVTGFTMENAPSNTFFLEYINRTTTAEIFFEDILMACVFYGMPILCENNKPRLLYHFKNRGYRGYSLNRPDKPANRLSVTEREIGGIPSSSADVITTHASMIENFIVNFVGVYDEQEETRRVREYGAMGSFYFMETLKDWLSFDINNREKHDASISSGYALMGLNRAKLTPVPEIKPITIGLTTYSQSGYHSSFK